MKKKDRRDLSENLAAESEITLLTKFSPVKSRNQFRTLSSSPSSLQSVEFIWFCSTVCNSVGSVLLEAQAFFYPEIKKMKIKNCYFPVFVSPSILEKEKDHIEGFAPEVRVCEYEFGNIALLYSLIICCLGDKVWATDLQIPIAIRPTSENVMVSGYVAQMMSQDPGGLVLPPKVASVQVIVIPLNYKDVDIQAIFNPVSATVNTLSEASVRAESDSRDNYSPGWKYSHWEMKGVPLRIEIGPNDLAN
ncbi:hypothetical protein RIF29_19151 [Crotalaria pallida]|uniref:Anticodon-binding domain-containing protein n=1 Tax=Crotalaria pallida TaxID=3830 RepID=A0AAN9EYX4_CROPI